MTHKKMPDLMYKYMGSKPKIKKKKRKPTFDILKPKTAHLIYDSLTPKQWIDQQNLMAEISHEGLEFDEVPEDQKHQPNIWRQEKAEKIDRERKAIFRDAKNNKWTTKKDFTIDEICFGWEKIAVINATRAIIEIRKNMNITNPKRIWILNKIKSSGSISPTKLYSEGFRERDYKSPALAKMGINSSLKAMLKSGVIELIQGKGFSSYKLLNVEFDNGEWFRTNKGVE